MISLTVKHGKRKIKAQMDKMSDKYFLFRFNDREYHGAELSIRPLGEQISADTPFDTMVKIRGIYHVETAVGYHDGDLKLAIARTTQGDLISPQRGFEFWLFLSQALRLNDETPEQVKSNLESIAHITSLDELFEALRETHGSLDALYNRELLLREGKAGFYHPRSLD